MPPKAAKEKEPAPADPVPQEPEEEQEPVEPPFIVATTSRRSEPPFAIHRADLEPIVAARAEEGDAGRLEVGTEAIDAITTTEFDKQFAEQRMIRLSKRWAAEFSCTHMIEIVQLLTKDHDGLVSEPGPANLHSWEADEEAPPSSCDNWSRGSVPMRVTFNPATVVDKEKRPKSSGSETSKRSKVSRVSSVRTHKTGETAHSEKTSKTKKTQLGSNLVAEKGGKQKSAPDDPDDPLRQRIRARQQSRREEAAQVEAEVRIREKMDKMSKEAKGREFTYDCHGEMMVIAPPEPDRLPSMTVGPKVAVFKPPDQPDERPQPKKRAKEEEPIYFKSVDLEQPSVYQTITLAAGVTLREGTMSKTGGVKGGDDMRMTKKQFQAKFDTFSFNAPPVAAPASASPAPAVAPVEVPDPVSARLKEALSPIAPKVKPWEEEKKVEPTPPLPSGPGHNWTHPPRLSTDMGVVPEKASPLKVSSPTRPAEPPGVPRARPRVSPLPQSHSPPPMYPSLSTSGGSLRQQVASYREGSSGGEDLPTTGTSLPRKKGHFPSQPPARMETQYVVGNYSPDPATVMTKHAWNLFMAEYHTMTDYYILQSVFY